MKKRGVEFFVCGQYLAGEKLDPKTLAPEVTVAADALLVLMQSEQGLRINELLTPRLRRESRVITV